jgi:hypothetical protein
VRPSSILSSITQIHVLVALTQPLQSIVDNVLASSSSTRHVSVAVRSPLLPTAQGVFAFISTLITIPA